jgi:hypothetical protein
VRTPRNGRKARSSPEAHLHRVLTLMVDELQGVLRQGLAVQRQPRRAHVGRSLLEDEVIEGPKVAVVQLEPGPPGRHPGPKAQGVHLSLDPEKVPAAVWPRRAA